MTFTNYIYKNGFYITLFILSIFLVDSLLYVTSVQISTILFVDLLFLIPLILAVSIKYYQKRKFYSSLFTNIEKLEKAYLVHEIIDHPTFIEGELFMDAFYQINKSMNENVKELECKHKEFKEYLELWIHEIKTPVASLSLLLHNQNNQKALNQVSQIDNYLEQILFYFRSEVSEKDFNIKPISLNQLINTILIKNMEILLQSNITMDVKNVDYMIYSDTKWLEFILQQIIMNSIKYMKEDHKQLSIHAKEDEQEIILSIIDNGIGIPDFDLPRVFDKSFTGENGRKHKNSTGMGLYISKNLCDQLGHKIEVESKVDAYTKVSLHFGISNHLTNL